MAFPHSHGLELDAELLVARPRARLGSWTLAVGRRAHIRLATPVQTAARPLRAARRHPRRVPPPRLLACLLALASKDPLGDRSPGAASCSLGDGRRRCAGLRPHPQPARRPQHVDAGRARARGARTTGSCSVASRRRHGAATSVAVLHRCRPGCNENAVKPDRPRRPQRRRAAVAGDHGRSRHGGFPADLRRLRRTGEYGRNTACAAGLPRPSAHARGKRHAASLVDLVGRRSDARARPRRGRAGRARARAAFPPARLL